MEFSNIGVGEILNKVKGKQEGVFVDIDDSGMQIIVNYFNPSPEEIEQFSQRKPFEIKFVTLQGIIMFALKIGDLNWMDAAYSPHLSLNLTHDLPYFSDGNGLATILVLTDASTARIVALRMIGLSEKFSNSLASEIKDAKNRIFSSAVYEANLRQLYSKYQTKDIVKLASDRFRI